ncbi:MAG: tetratricopeptide repeat protein [Pseudomonadota bacterium]
MPRLPWHFYLGKTGQPGWKQIEQTIWIEWSKSGSPSADLLLRRGRDAMEEDEIAVAIEHLTALTDHAPDFPEGWNARATAYFRAGLYGPSLEDIHRAISLNPRHFGALSGLAIILEELRYETEALEAYRAVQAIHPHRPNIKDAIERLEKKLEGRAL